MPTAAAQPGTGTPGYWKNHPEAWPVGSITVGGATYSKAQAISLLGKTGKDKTITMFQSLVSAILSVKIGNDGSCINAAIAQGNAWLAANPLGSNVAGGWPLGRRGSDSHHPRRLRQRPALRPASSVASLSPGGSG